MRAEEIQGLMEAYSKVNATPEILSEEVLDLSDEDLEGIELIEMTMEEIEQLDEQGGAGGAAAQTAKRQRVAAQGQVKTALGQGKGIGLQSASGLGQGTKPGQKAFGTQLGGRQGVVVKGGASGPNYGPRGGSSFTRAADTVNVGGQTLYKAKKGNDIVYLQGKGKSQLFKPGQSAPAPGTPARQPTPGTPARQPSSGTPARQPSSGGPTGQGKPTTPPAAPQKPKGSAMDQWRAANPKLAAAADEKARIRGTSQTDNPLMKDMRSKMSMTPSVQSPAVAKLGAGNQSLVNNPNASKAATPKPAAAAKPTTPAPSTASTAFGLAKKGVNLAADVDIFDLVKGHLLGEGYADSEEGAMVIMVNMSEEWRKSILEAHGVELDENREHDREMRKAAARERAEEKRDRKEEGKKSAKSPGREGPSAGKSYADYQEISIKSHDKKTKGKHTVGNPFPEHVEYVDEAQEAREKPEEHEEKEEKENEKKYGHVRGEKTPMPPRGDKRREEFEKWYAKQMGR